MISDRIKKLIARISAAKGPEGGVYIIRYVDGVPTCLSHEITWLNEEELAKWKDTLQGENVILRENYPGSRECRKT